MTIFNGSTKKSTGCLWRMLREEGIYMSTPSSPEMGTCKQAVLEPCPWLLPGNIAIAAANEHLHIVSCHRPWRYIQELGKQKAKHGFRNIDHERDIRFNCLKVWSNTIFLNDVRFCRKNIFSIFWGARSQLFFCDTVSKVRPSRSGLERKDAQVATRPPKRKNFWQRPELYQRPSSTRGS
jgi:hypothetical protein